MDNLTERTAGKFKSVIRDGRKLYNIIILVQDKEKQHILHMQFLVSYSS